MATKKPRMTITIEPEHHAVVAEVARLRGVSKSTVVTEMLGASIPALERVSKLLEALEAARSGGYVEDFKASLDEAEKTLAPILSAALEQLDISASQPPHSNTGVTPNLEALPQGLSPGEKANDHKDLKANPPTKSKGARKRGSE